LSNIVVDP